jgi:hypothetical protein
MSDAPARGGSGVEGWCRLMEIRIGMGCGKAHDRLATISIAVSQGKGRLIDLLSNDPEIEITQILDRTTIENLMEPTN